MYVMSKLILNTYDVSIGIMHMYGVNCEHVDCEHVCCQHVDFEHVCCQHMDCEHACMVQSKEKQVTTTFSLYSFQDNHASLIAFKNVIS
mgnify:CR=1 FL=1